MPDLGLDHPTGIMRRLTEIENDLAVRQNNLESAARRWYGAKRDIEKEKARALLGSDRASVTEKKAEGDLIAYDVDGADAEAEYVALSKVVGVLETRASICQTLMNTHRRAGAA